LRNWAGIRPAPHEKPRLGGLPAGPDPAGGRLVLVGAPKGSRLLGPLGHIAGVRLASLRGGQKVVFFISKGSGEDLATLAELLEAGTVTPCVERTYPLPEAAGALRHLGEGHARGKLVVTV
jgi:NADPH:quinone reductase-like Zn-dependent oxidoreductase